MEETLLCCTIPLRPLFIAARLDYFVLFLLPLSLLYPVVVDVVVFVSVVVVIVMFKSLHLVEICTLTSAF